ncbi:benign gonial cell neoplasm protein isoform X1 [Drosophila tropicalis]|uniref:benign gonial cell neoplasm protein isoform X1 n=2 Tax=Drosophila tropicalis TaxID=46794 RepID=UPI0035AC268A
MMNQIIEEKFIPQQLLHFLAGRRCCQIFPCTFRTTDHQIFINSARALGLRSLCVFNNGLTIKVYKQACRHYLEDPKVLTLSSTTIMNLFTLLSRASLMATDLDICPDYIGFGEAEIEVPKLAVQLPLSQIQPPISRFKTESQRDFLRSFPGYSSLMEILSSIYSHRIVVFNADLYWDKSVYIPLLLLNDSDRKKTNLRVMCIEIDPIIAIHNSQRVSDFFVEEIGNTVGIDVPQSTILCSSTQIIYTTAKQFLRSMVSQNSEKFQNISHFVVNDVHNHEPFTDILLGELRDALNKNFNFRIILLSQLVSPTQFINFFGEGAELSMERLHSTGPRIFYLEDIHSCIALAGIHKGPDIYKDLPQVFRNKNQRNEQMDKCLQVYEELGTDASIRPFLYAINYELVPINYRHSISGKTAVLIASQLNNARHLRLLLYMGADPYMVDEQHQNAISLAAMKGNSECIDVLNNYSLHGYVVKNAKPEFLDYDLIIDIMYMLCTKPEFPPGNILIILPTYYHIVKLNYMLLSHCLTENLQEFSIFLLHEDMTKEYVETIINARSDTVMVILATDIIESLPLRISFKYEIDTACHKTSIYDSDSYCVYDRYEWVAKDCLFRRQSLLDPEDNDTQCFRLISKNDYGVLNEISRPRLQSMQLDKICLLVKLLSPYTVISEYLSFAISAPPLINIHHTVQILKKIEALNDGEEVTWLGCRLLDIPVPCQLGRTLIFGILLRCLDPILTIVSAMVNTDPLGIPFNEDIDQLWDRFTIFIQCRIKNERARLAENQYSDHFVFVRLFQEWHSRMAKKPTTYLFLTDEYDFVLNGLMERLNATRYEIIHALEAANLVHSEGSLSLETLNLKSASWPTVKAALTGGMYPNICAVDNERNCLKSAYSVNVHLHPNTVLRDFLEPFTKSAQKFQTPWIVCSKQKNHIVYATVVVPLAVALFAGSSHLRSSQVCDTNPAPNDRNVNLFIDEWIWMVMPKSVIELVVKTRQYFFKSYHYLLKNCNNPEMWARNSNYSLLYDTLATVLENEETEAGFQKFSEIDYQPFVKIPNNYILAVNQHFSWNQEIDDNRELARATAYDLNTHFVERQFFLLHTKESADDFYLNMNETYIEKVLGKFARPIESPNRHIFVILYSKNPDVMLSVSRARTLNGVFTLKEYFRNTIPVYEMLEACATINVNVPNFDGRLISCLIDKRVGKLIMDLFAFRHHWIHKRHSFRTDDSSDSELASQFQFLLRDNNLIAHIENV